MKTTNKTIRHLIATGCAIDWTHVENVKRPHNSTVIFFSVGDQGLNGIVIRDNASGQLYAVSCRCSNVHALAQ